MNKNGTYRIVKYADDGQYDIHWTCCDSHMQSCQWQPESFRFCPFCGAGNASKLECRRSDIARWAYDIHPDDECEADALSHDARVNAWKLENNQTRWVIEREGSRNSGSWYATHRCRYLRASDALEAADKIFADEVEDECSLRTPVVLRLRLVTGCVEQKVESPKVLESPRWVHDPAGDYAKEHGVSREEAVDKMLHEQFEKMMNEMEDEDE